MKKCPNCGKLVKKGKTGLYFHKETIKINPVSAYRCSSCGEEYIDEDEYERLRKKVRGVKLVDNSKVSEIYPKELFDDVVQIEFELGEY